VDIQEAIAFFIIYFSLKLSEIAICDDNTVICWLSVIITINITIFRLRLQKLVLFWMVVLTWFYFLFA